MVARLCEKFLRLSVPPKSVVKFVESTSTLSPTRRARWWHPDQRVEFRVTGLGEWVRPIRVDTLATQDAGDHRCVGVHRAGSVGPSPPALSSSNSPARTNSKPLTINT
jgi:hypothetical protein